MTYPNADILSKIEAVHYVNTGELPDNFTDRLLTFIEFYECGNCGGQEDMNFVFRAWLEDEPSWCSDCVLVDNGGNRLDG